MRAVREPLPLTWPLFEQDQHFELGTILSSVVTDLIVPAEVGRLGIAHAGCWECDLADNSLIWSGGVYDIFGLPRDATITRKEIVALYCEESRVAMERLRSYAIRYRRGFTLDAEIHPVIGGQRRMRLITAPICEGTRVVRLHGLKFII
jgi:hypothetical protein